MTAERPAALAVTVALLVLAASPVSAARKKGVDLFEKHYTEASEHYAAKRYDEALASFEAAFAERAEPEALYGASRCHHQLHHLGKAADGYERFLALAPEGHEGIVRARGYLVEVLLGLGQAELAVSRPVEALRAFTRGLEVHALGHPALTDATSAILMVGQAESHEALKDPGAAERAYMRAMDALLTDDGRARVAERLAILRGEAPPTPPTAATPPPSVAVKTRRRGSLLWPAIPAALAVGAALTGLALGIPASAGEVAMDGTQREYFEKYESRRSRARAANGLYITAGVLAAASVVVYVLAGPRKVKEVVSVAAGPGGAGVSVTF